MRIRIKCVAYDDVDARLLVAGLQAEYANLYGAEDEPVDPVDFALPRGVFMVAYLEGAPIACGGWRLRDPSHVGYTDGDVELKRLYVHPEFRGHGVGRELLRQLEEWASALSHRRMVLETGIRQSEAIQLYWSHGYRPVQPYGPNAASPVTRCMGKELTASAVLVGQRV